MNDADSLQDYQRVRQQAIRSLFEIVEGSSEGTVIVDREARIVWINQRYAQRFGLADPAQAIGRPCESVIPGSLLREVVGSGKPILLDMMDSAKDPLVVMRLPIHDDAGEVIGAIGFALLDELRSLSPLVTRYLSMQRELASTRSQLQARQPSTASATSSAPVRSAWKSSAAPVVARPAKRRCCCSARPAPARNCSPTPSTALRRGRTRPSSA